jgi:hypothetical protein
MVDVEYPFGIGGSIKEVLLENDPNKKDPF